MLLFIINKTQTHIKLWRARICVPVFFCRTCSWNPSRNNIIIHYFYIHYTKFDNKMRLPYFLLYYELNESQSMFKDSLEYEDRMRRDYHIPRQALKN